MGRYILSVGEPWDFTGPDGENQILGDIIKIVSPNCILFKARNPVTIGEVVGDIFVLFVRTYKGAFESSKNYEEYVNAGILQVPLDDTMSEKELGQNSKFVIVGGLHMI